MNPTPEPCPECGGKCCRDSYRYKLTHMGDEFYEHVCDACHDGTRYVPPRTAEDERSDLVAYLAHAARFPNPTLPMNQYLDTLRELVECGAHVGFSTKKEKP